MAVMIPRKTMLDTSKRLRPNLSARYPAGISMSAWPNVKIVPNVPTWIGVNANCAAMAFKPTPKDKRFAE